MMFGYIKPLKCELKVREYEEFRRYYCGVCRALKRYSIVPRLLLTYEAASLSLLLSSLKGEHVERKRNFCFFTLKKVEYYQSESINRVAEIFVALLSEKMRDNYLDTKNPIYLLVKSFLKKDPKISKLFDRFYTLERKKANFEELAKEQGRILGKILESTVEEEDQRRILYHLGVHLGEWLYIVDALDDFEKDKKKGVYNPLVEEYRDFERAKNAVKDVLEMCINEIWKAYDLLNLKRNRSILDNIMYLGAPAVTERIFMKQRESSPAGKT
ncbi:DUF5685 family protein [Thermotoga neapolitana]|uniref:Uncharacterized protein n=2 Tax=Thermotogaceae TaxID=188709 RepID=B9K7E6_THENN|nr:DUF5685 family protein [Thermotoga neapolitana]ACM22879.1 Putative uncharacterized protein [Thermotoga neapolitana DSM 4359]